MRSLFVAAAAILFARQTVTRPPGPSGLVGLYTTPAGGTLIVYAPSDSTLGIGFGDGEVRGLKGSRNRWAYGPSLGVFTPQQGTIVFVTNPAGFATAVRWTAVGQPAVVALRVALAEESVQFGGGDGARLAGSLIMPATTPSSTVVFLHGSDKETREGSRALAYAMAAQGVATLIYDKRSTGQSTGTLDGATFAELADDAAGAVAFLRAHPTVGTLPIGIFGPSQGSWIALETTRRRADVDFLILQSGDVTTPLAQEMFRGAESLRRVLQVPESDVRELTDYRRMKFMVAITGQGQATLDQRTAEVRERAWFRYVGANLPNRSFWVPNGLYDPAPALAAYRGPVLAVFGERDSYKDVTRNADGMRSALTRAGNPASRVVVMPQSNHGIFVTSTGLPLDREMALLSRLAPGYIQLLVEFAREHHR